MPRPLFLDVKTPVSFVSDAEFSQCAESKNKEKQCEQKQIETMWAVDLPLTMSGHKIHDEDPWSDYIGINATHSSLVSSS